MSNDIREYTSEGKGSNLMLTAFVAKGGGNIQFTIGTEYCGLTQQQLLDMIYVITRRLLLKDGFRATDSSETKIIDAVGGEV